MTDLGSPVIHSQIWEHRPPQDALLLLHSGMIDAIVWDATPEIRTRNMRYCPNKNTIYVAKPYPKELTNV